MSDFVRRHRPAPGTVLGLIALIVALAGTALAGPLASTSVLTKKEKKQTRKIARSEIATAAPKLSVKSATTATNATNATNAGQVDGHDAVCPAGTFLQGGTCFESVDRGNSDWTGAAQSCADAGGFLPSPSELLSIRNVAGINLGLAGAGHWVDARYQDAAVNEAMTVLDNGALEGVALAGPRTYRCGFRLVR